MTFCLYVMEMGFHTYLRCLPRVLIARFEIIDLAVLMEDIRAKCKLTSEHVC